MRLVIVWNESDGCTYSCENVQCLEYKSAEDFLVDFEAWKLTEPENTWTGFAGLDLGRHQDVGGLEIYELEEWFEKTQRHILKVHEQL